MSYVIRNTIFIAVFWLIVLIGGLYYVYGYQAKQDAKLRIEVKKKTERVNDLKMMQITRHELTQEYDYLKDLSLGKMGALAGNETPGETFDYMLREIGGTQSKLELNQELVVQEKFKSFDRNTYLLTGESAFSDFYQLVWFLENGPIFYNIQSVNMDRITPDQKFQEDWTEDRGDLTFALSVWGFKKDKGLEMDSLRRHVGQPRQLATLVENSVSAALDQKIESTQRRAASAPDTKMAAAEVLDSAPSKREGQETRTISNPNNLPEITPATEILAITPSSILIRDQRNQIVKLRKGDRVLGGSVGNINVKSGSVGFYLNTGSGYKSLELSLTKN